MRTLAAQARWWPSRKCIVMFDSNIIFSDSNQNPQIRSSTRRAWTRVGLLPRWRRRRAGILRSALKDTRRRNKDRTSERNGVPDISRFLFTMVQGLPLPKEVWNPRRVPHSIKFSAVST